MPETDKLNDLLLESRENLDELGVPFYLLGSTLLGIYRDNTMIPTGSVDLACLASDLSREKVDNEFMKVFGAFNENECKSPIGLLYLKDGHLELHPTYFREEWGYLNLIKDECLYWPKHHFEKFDTIKYLGKEWRIPSNTDEYLTFYYGDWRSPKPTYSWRVQAPNYKKLNDI